MKLQKARGFTLLEILVGASIMVLVCFLVLKMSIHILDTWEGASKRLDNENDLRLALDIIGRDLETSLPYYWISGNRFSFYGFGKTEYPRAIVYDVDKEGLYRCIKNCEKKYYGTEVLEEIPLSFGEMKKSSNLVAREVKGLIVKFLCKNSQGKVEWTSRIPFLGTVIGAEVIVLGAENKRMSRRVMLIGVSKL